MVKEIDTSDITYEGPDKIPIIETYINICNAYSFQGMNQEAIEYADGSITMSQRILDVMVMRFESGSQTMTSEEKDRLAQHYHHLVSMHIMSY